MYFLVVFSCFFIFNADMVGSFYFFRAILSTLLTFNAEYVTLKEKARRTFMLKNIPKIVSPALIKVLCEMGHGDEIVIADGNFPSETNGQRVIRADGIGGEEMLDAVLSLIPLDTYAQENLLLMQTTNGDPTPEIWDKYFAVAKKDAGFKGGNLERFEFYERAKKAYAVIASGEEAIYANIILKKGVIK